MRTDNYGLSFDDVLITPNYSAVRSRSCVDLSVRIGSVDMSLPVIAANMDTVCEGAMVAAMDTIGCVGVVHRNLPLETRFRLAGLSSKTRSAVAFGVNEDIDTVIREAKENSIKMLVLDIAHGHSEHALNTIRYVRKQLGETVTLVGGNVATGRGTLDLIEAGVDAVKVGIGPGAACSTRVVTGVGVPQLTAVSECASAADGYDVQIIADGGIRSSGDAAKALAAGAHAVMLGSMLAGTDEAPGEFKTIRPGVQAKAYRGMASTEAGSDYPEGVSGYVTYKGSAASVVESIRKGVVSTCSYVGACNLYELRRKARFIQVSPSSLKESAPHGLHGL